MSADSFKRRRKRDTYEDFCQLVPSHDEELFFLGGNDYLPLFYRLTADAKAQKIVLHSSKNVRRVSGYQYRHYVTKRRTNWHYECATAFLNGELSRR